MRACCRKVINKFSTKYGWIVTKNTIFGATILFMYNCTVMAKKCETVTIIVFTINEHIFKYKIGTDQGSLIGNTQHGNFRIFLPVIFYMRSILVIQKPQKLPFWPCWAALNFAFLDIFDSFKCEIPKKSNFKAFKLVKMTVFDPLQPAKIDFTYNQRVRTIPN